MEYDASMSLQFFFYFYKERLFALSTLFSLIALFYYSFSKQIIVSLPSFGVIFLQFNILHSPNYIPKSSKQPPPCEEFRKGKGPQAGLAPKIPPTTAKSPTPAAAAPRMLRLVASLNLTSTHTIRI